MELIVLLEMREIEVIFPKGHIPTNAFLKGHVPHNWLPVGSEITKGDGYVYVKISDTKNVHSRFNWKQKHILLWEKENGPLPKKRRLLFLDGDKQHISLDNLTLVDENDILQLVRNGLISDDRELTLTGLKIVQLIKLVASKEKELKR
jgi:hypothetical protein